MIHFLEEDYVTAEGLLREAYEMCLATDEKNLELILTYLIPTRLLTSQDVKGTIVLP